MNAVGYFDIRQQVNVFLLQKYDKKKIITSLKPLFNIGFLITMTVKQAKKTWFVLFENVKRNTS